jgi:pseudouridine-5'-phosphate glycosidase
MIHYSREVASARANNAPIVALESTIIAHGLPRPRNLETAREIEATVRANGATPATIALIDGEVHVGVESEQLERIANDPSFVKASIRDLATLLATGRCAATTVAATAHIANRSGIALFATGGLGGVHRGANQTWDESADLLALATIPVIVVSAGVKSILDIPATLERLETLSIPILGYQTRKFPGFYLSDSGYEIEHSAASPAEIAGIWRASREIGTDRHGLVVANPVQNQMSPELHNRMLSEGLAAAEAAHITGKAATPFLLEYFHANSGGESLRVNVEIILANAKLAAQIACNIK